MKKRTDYFREYMRKRRAKLKAMGICTRCGKGKLTDNYSCCEKCRLKDKMRYTKIKEILQNAGY